MKALYIENCTVIAIGSMYRIIANEGWYIHLNDGIEDTTNIYKDAEILGGSNNETVTE